MKKKISIDPRFFSFYRTALTKISVVFLFLPSLIFFFAFLLVYFINQGVKKETQTQMLPPQLFSSFYASAYPILPEMTNDSLLGQMRLSDDLSAQGVLIMDNESKIILFSKNVTVPFTMASTTKIMTALVALEHYKLDDILIIKSTNVPPAIVGYPLGEMVKFRDMLYGMLLPSGNDAALAIAQNYPGGEMAFIQRMNDKAKELGLSHTHFNDSSGLDNGNYTTPKELGALTSVALQNPFFAKVVNTKEKLTTNAYGTKAYPLTNINQLLGSFGVNGVKTGFTPDAGGMLVTSSVNKGHTVIYVVMKSDDRFGDTEKLLKKTYGAIKYLSITP